MLFSLCKRQNNWYVNLFNFSDSKRILLMKTDCYVIFSKKIGIMNKSIIVKYAINNVIYAQNRLTVKVLLFVVYQFSWFLWIALSNNLGLHRNITTVAQIKTLKGPHENVASCIQANNLENTTNINKSTMKYIYNLRQDFLFWIFKNFKLYQFQPFDVNKNMFWALKVGLPAMLCDYEVLILLPHHSNTKQKSFWDCFKFFSFYDNRFYNLKNICCIV